MKLVVVSSDLPQVYCSLLPKLELADALSSLLIFTIAQGPLQLPFWQMGPIMVKIPFLTGLS